MESGSEEFVFWTRARTRRLSSPAMTELGCGGRFFIRSSSIGRATWMSAFCGKPRLQEFFLAALPPAAKEFVPAGLWAPMERTRGFANGAASILALDALFATPAGDTTESRRGRTAWRFTGEKIRRRT